jgi:predicted nucleotidyltransferase
MDEARIRRIPAALPSLEKMRDRLAPLSADHGLQLVVLFGSAASGKMHKGSDVDLAFLFDVSPDILELTNRVIRRLRIDNVDVVDLRRASPLLRMSVVKSGHLLYERSPGIYTDFCSLSFRMYADSKKLRDAQARSIKRFIERESDGELGTRSR